MKRKKIIKIAVISFVALLLWGIIWSYFISITVRKNNKDNKMKNQHAIVKNIIVTETREENKYWEFYAKTGEYTSEHNFVQLNDIIGNFYKDNEVVLSFKSQKGTYDEETKKVVLKGDNVFVAKNGQQFYADNVIWQGQDSDILADGNIRYIQNDKIITKADKAIFNSTFTNFKVIGKTETQIFADKNEKKKYTHL